METWRDAIGFESYYEVSNYGNVRRKGKWTGSRLCNGRLHTVQRQAYPGELNE